MPGRAFTSSTEAVLRSRGSTLAAGMDGVALLGGLGRGLPGTHGAHAERECRTEHGKNQREALHRDLLCASCAGENRRPFLRRDVRPNPQGSGRVAEGEVTIERNYRHTIPVSI